LAATFVLMSARPATSTWLWAITNSESLTHD
jgi:hypothetical protein